MPRLQIRRSNLRATAKRSRKKGPATASNRLPFSCARYADSNLLTQNASKSGDRVTCIKGCDLNAARDKGYRRTTPVTRTRLTSRHVTARYPHHLYQQLFLVATSCWDSPKPNRTVGTTSEGEHLMKRSSHERVCTRGLRLCLEYCRLMSSAV